MNCTTTTHIWLWFGAGTGSSCGDHVRCRCGAYTYGEWHSLRNENARLTALLAERDAEIPRLRDALAWYADERNYDVDDYDHEDVPGEIIGGGIRCPRCGIKGCQAYFEPDRGKRARAALAARGGEAPPASGGG